MQTTRYTTIQALPILFLIFLLQTLFLCYLDTDRGSSSFINALATKDGILAVAMWTSVFTLIGVTLFSIFNKIRNLSFIAKIIIAAILAAPTSLTIWYILYLTFKAF